MQGKKGASPETTRRIHKKLLKDLAEQRAVLARKQGRPDYNAATCLTAETVRLMEFQLSGKSPPVGVLKGPWQEVCDAHNRA